MPKIVGTESHLLHPIIAPINKVSRDAESWESGTPSGNCQHVESDVGSVDAGRAASRGSHYE